MSRADSPLQNRMIFIVGARRSGTFWLQRLITAHPDVEGIPGETYLFSHGIAPLFERFNHGLRATPRVGQMWMEREALLDATRDFCDRVLLSQFEKDTTYLAERTPSHAEHLDLIGELYPDASVVHIVRDGRDVVRSLLAKQWGPDSVEAAACEWRKSVLAARGAAFPGRYVEVVYERLLRDPGAETKRLFEELGLPATDDIIASAVAEGSEEVNIDLETFEVEAGKWRKELGRSAVNTVERIAGDLLQDLGYELSAPGEGRREWPRPRLPRFRLRRREGVPEPPAVTDGAGARLALASLDALIAAMKAGDAARATSLLTRDATLTVVAGAERRTSDGDDARAALTSLIQDDEALRGEQARTEVYVQPAGATAIVRFELEGGRAVERIYVLGAEAERISSLVVYQLPGG